MTAGVRSVRHVAGNLRQRTRKDWRVTWRWVHNLGPTVRHLRSPASLTPSQAEAVERVRRDGIAIVSAEALLADPKLVAEVRAAVAEVEATQGTALAEARARLAAAPLDGEEEKPFLYVPLGETPVLDIASPYARLAEALAPLADGYFGMETQIRSYAVLRNLASDAPATDSQRWHRDREDFQILKAFVYLDDVPSEAGPFWYVPGTHALGSNRRVAESSPERGVLRTDDDQMEVVSPKESWLECAGPAGSIVLADTRGYHKGGHATTTDRLVLMVMYTSQDSGVREWFDRSSAEVPTARLRRFRWTRG